MYNYNHEPAQPYHSKQLKLKYTPVVLINIRLSLRLQNHQLLL